MPRGGGRVGCGVGRIDRLGRHASADFGARRPRFDLSIGRGQSAGHRARCRRRLRPEGAVVLSGRTARSDGGDAARTSSEIHRGSAREFHRLFAGADANPHHRACRAQDRRGYRAARQLPARYRRVHSLRHRSGAGRLDLDRRPVSHPQHLGRVQGGLYADRAGHALSRLRPAAGLLRHRARDGPIGRGAEHRPVRNPPPQFHFAKRNFPIRAKACCSPTD